MTAASAKLFRRRVPKQARFRAMQPMAIDHPATIGDPRARLTAIHLAKLRRCLRLSPEVFAKVFKISTACLTNREEHHAAWSADAIAKALPALGELLAEMQHDLNTAEEALADLATEIE